MLSVLQVLGLGLQVEGLLTTHSSV